MKKKNRREFLSTSAKGLGLFVAGGSMIQFLNACSKDENPVSSEPKSFSIDISDSKYSALQNIGGTIALSASDLSGLPDNGIFLIRTSNTEITVLSRTCSHQACQVGPFNGSIATCPCHGSAFNTTGAAVKGPATGSLRKYNSTLSGNMLTFTI
ncbi:MAG: hypothetical protein D6830_05880 [Ignavibacteria bacterium]|nr:MAG: hypothetical protein D6830_05880 [Ignavibacteria bacterium]